MACAMLCFSCVVLCHDDVDAVVVVPTSLMF